jgi:hypothetical protein
MDSILSQIRNGQLPDSAKSAVVQGFMPLEPETLLEAVFLLCSQDSSYLQDAQSTVTQMPESVLKGYFENRELTAGPLAFYAENFSFATPVVGVLVLHPALPGAALAQIAPTLDASLLDLLVNNQVKILEAPEIIERLRSNPALGVHQAQRLDEYHRLLLRELVEPAEKLENLAIEEVEQQAIEVAREFVKTFGKESVTLRDMVSDAEQEKKDSVLKQLSVMSVPQKVQAAIKGGREIRQALIRDANRLVSAAVIKSPRITEAEVEFYTNMRSLASEVIRLISLNREWMQNYKIVHNLIKNPRTPIDMSMKLLPRLVGRDLKQLELDKGVPEVLRKTAKRMAKTAKR